MTVHIWFAVVRFPLRPDMYSSGNFVHNKCMSKVPGTLLVSESLHGMLKTTGAASTLEW